jgi:hypothetical protein
MFFYPLPFVTFAFTAFLVFIEAKSVLEKANEKDRRKAAKSLRDVAVMLENKDNIIQLIEKLTELDKQQNKENKSDDNKQVF